LRKPLTILLLVILFLSAFVSLVQFPIVHAQTVITLDSYSESNSGTDNYRLQLNHPSATAAKSALGQTVNVSETATLSSATFYLKKASTPTGNLAVHIYAMTGTLGSSGLPTGSSLATSDAIASSTLTTSNQLINFTFSGANKIVMNANQTYAVALQADSATFSGTAYVWVGSDITSPTHQGNYFYYASGAWSGSGGSDMVFYLYGEPASIPCYGTTGQTSQENGYSTTLYSSWYVAGTGGLSNYTFSYRLNGGAWANASTYAFPDTNNTWANSTFTLHYALGVVYDWCVYAQTDNGKQNVTEVSSLVVQASIAFYSYTGGLLRRNGTTVSNGTVTAYTSPTVLGMNGIPLSGYSFANFSWYSGTQTTTENPYQLVVENYTAFYARFTAENGTEPPVEPPDFPIPEAGTSARTLYFHKDTQEVNGVTGYAALETVPNQAESLSIETAGSKTITWGWRVYLQYDGRTLELTGGVPVAEATQLSSGGNQSGLINSTYTLGPTNLYFGRVALKFMLYSRWDSGDWSAQGVYISELLYSPQLETSVVTFSVYAVRGEAGGTTYASIYWGTGTYDSGIDGLVFRESRSTDWQNYYLVSGNFLAFLYIPYTAMIGNLFYALILFGIGMSVYIRYRQLSMVLLLIILLGGSGGVLQLAIGDAFMGVVWVVAAFGLALVYWRLFR